jgi:hypothetical protein
MMRSGRAGRGTVRGDEGFLRIAFKLRPATHGIRTETLWAEPVGVGRGYEEANREHPHRDG